MDITYKKVGDYYYPELELPKKYKDFRLDKYGRLRLNYLKENKHIQYEIMKCGYFNRSFKRSTRVS